MRRTKTNSIAAYFGLWANECKDSRYLPTYLYELLEHGPSTAVGRSWAGFIFGLAKKRKHVATTTDYIFDRTVRAQGVPYRT